MDNRALVDALVAGDPRGLEGAYRAYADRLYTYCRGLLRDPDQAADAVHDTFVLAGQRAGQLRDPERLRSWLYAIARNECLRVLRGRARQAPLPEPDQMTADAPEPTDTLRAAELQELVWAASAGLNPGDRDVFELTVRHDLAAAEMSEVLGVSVDHAHARLSRVRAQLERALGALVVARTGRRDCPELASILSGWDGRLTALVRKRVSRHVETCDTCQERRRTLLTPAALFSAYATAPFLLVPAEVWPRLERISFEPEYEFVRQAIARRAGEFEPETGFPKPLDASRFRVLAAAAVAVAMLALIAAGAGAMLLPSDPSAAPAAPPPSAAPLAPPSPAPYPPASPGANASPGETPSGDPVAPALAPGQPGPPAAPPAGPPGAPPGIPPVPPSPRPSTATSPSTSPTVPPEPFTATASAEPRCGDGVYQLSVSATANKPISAATLFLTVDGNLLSGTPMDMVNESTAVGLTGTLRIASVVVWWVEVGSIHKETFTTTRVELLGPCLVG